MSERIVQERIRAILINCCRELGRRSSQDADESSMRSRQLQSLLQVPHLSEDDRGGLRLRIVDADRHCERMGTIASLAEAAESELDRGTLSTFVELLQTTGLCPEGSTCQGRRACVELLAGFRSSALESIAQLISSDDIA